MFDVFYSGVKPNLFVHERATHDLEHARQLSRTRYFWWINYLSDYTGFDFLFEPVPWESQYTHTWPSQHHAFSGTYLVPTHVQQVEYKFHTKIIPNQSRPDHFHNIISGVQFDCTWHPHPHDPPYQYVFGNQWWPANRMPTVEYHVPGATERKYIFDPCARLPERHTNHWHTLHDCEWDYSWVPDPGDPPLIYVFGNQWWPAVTMPTVEYHVPGATKRKYMSHPRAQLIPDQVKWTIPDGVDTDSFDFTWCPDPGDPPYIYQFGTQHQRTGGPRYVMPDADTIKYVSRPRVAKISVDQDKWTIPDGVDTDSFDFTWHPDDTDDPYIYQFGTQHQRTGGPRYVMPDATEIKFVDQIRIRTERVATAIYEIDHLDGHAGQIPDTTKTVRYFDNYLDTLLRLARNIQHQHEFVWICSSICDYRDFDFSWHPEQWQASMLHVFASDDQKFGDTFFMHVPSFVDRAQNCQLLEWYDVNFVDRSVPRRAMPVIVHDLDSHVPAVKTQDWLGPLALFTVADTPDRIPVVPLWRSETKTIVPLSAGAGAVVVPRVAKASIRTQLYDYKHIDRSQRGVCQDHPLDIVFIDNGEPNAEENWKYLGDCHMFTNQRIERSSGVNGRVAAYHAAARLSATPWFFAVFAKLRVNKNFDWSWQPDRMQMPKHYIFQAFNPTNGLTYGHQAMIAYNKQLVLDNPGVGLDFTLDSAHEVVPILSGTAEYAHTPWMAWRTAFREALKLKGSDDVESQYRLNRWCANGTGVNAQWSSLGAQDAVEYYEEVGGNFDELRKSYDWAWLASYALLKRNLTQYQ